MKNSKLIQGLSFLSKSQWERFCQMAESPYFGLKPQALALLRHLDTYAPEFADAEDPQAAFAAIHPGESFDKQKLKDAQSWLFRLLMEFFALEEIQEQNYLTDSLSLRRLRKMRAQRLFHLQRNALIRKLEKPTADPNDFWHNAWFNLHEESDRAVAQSQGRPSAEHIEASMAALDASYATRKLRTMCELQNRYNIHGGEKKQFWAETLVQEPLPEAAAELAPAVPLYEKILVFLRDATRTDAFSDFTQELVIIAPKLPQEEARVLYTYAQNFCIAQINKGNSDYLQRIFDLFRQQLDNGLLFVNGFLSHGNFTNIVTTALRLKEINWVNDFMPRFYNKLLPQQRETVYQYNRANVHYQQGELRQAQRELQTIEFTDGFYASSAKLLACRVYYELEEDELLSYLIAAFQRHLQRSKDLSSRHRLPRKEFLRFLKKLQKLRERYHLINKPQQKKRTQALFEAITNAENLALRSWLLTQLEYMRAE
ncbi:MAG: hypothetical protein AB8F95_12890 [Bacteroidia bacterium]